MMRVVGKFDQELPAAIEVNYILALNKANRNKNVAAFFLSGGYT
jgi:hypothetical protein